MTQAAVFGSEDCELTEELWASTESQKLKEFSEKVSMTTTATATAIATAPPDAASKGIWEVEPPQQRLRPPTEKVTARFDIEGEAGRSSTRSLGDSPLPPCALATADAGGEGTAPFYSSTFGSGDGGIPAEAISTDIAMVGGRFNGASSAAATITSSGAACAPSEATDAASASTRPVGEEVETVGWRGALSAPGDPEITHPERVQ